MIFDSPHIPLTGITLVEEGKLLDQLDAIRSNLPEILEKALKVLQAKAQIIQDAEVYAEQLMAAAELKAAQTLNEMVIVQQAEQLAGQIRQEAALECQKQQDATLKELEEKRRLVNKEIQEMRAIARQDCDDVQRGADQYANHVLSGLEGQLQSMLNIVRNGRQQLQLPPKNTDTKSSKKNTKSNLKKRP